MFFPVSDWVVSTLGFFNWKFCSLLQLIVLCQVGMEYSKDCAVFDWWSILFSVTWSLLQFLWLKRNGHLFNYSCCLHILDSALPAWNKLRLGLFVIWFWFCFASHCIGWYPLLPLKTRLDTLEAKKKTWIKLFLHSVLLLSFLNMNIGYVFTLFLVCSGHEEHLTKVFVFAMYFTKSFLLI